MSKATLKLFNSLTGQLEPFEPLEANHVRMYVCGPTVYDDAHLGHARCYITWDVLYRFLKFLGHDVTYVRNVTDVDDKILNRAKERGLLPSEVAEKNYQSFTEDMQALNILPPSQEPRATQYIPAMLDGIQALINNNAAYATPDGSVYFRVAAKADYGKLKFQTNDPSKLKKHLDDLKAGARVEVGEIKESALDFALWKAVPLEDPNGWESPWPATGKNKGWGRPGWHMECSAMNHAVFGEQIDIHAGGADLIFPHHENEIAQSEAWSGKEPFARYWLHNGFVNVSGEKMSKSLGNFSTIKKLLDRYDANTIRYFLLTNHYRMPVDFNEEALQAAENRIPRMNRTFAQSFKELGWTANDLQPLLNQTLAQSELSPEASQFVQVMQEDLNTSQALAILNERLDAVSGQLAALSSEQNHLAQYTKEAVQMFNALGFSLQALFNKQTSSEEVQNISDEIAKRKQAKAEKNWALADSIRKQITELGYQLLDNKDGTTSVEKDGLEIVRV